jgi:DNA-binding NarL/FixJ family response regulator
MRNFDFIGDGEKDEVDDFVSIVAITSYTNRENINRCYEVGIKEIIHKPVSAQKLMEAVNKYHEKKN